MGKRLEVDGQDVISTDDQTGDIQASFDSVDTERLSGIAGKIFRETGGSGEGVNAPPGSDPWTLDESELTGFLGRAMIPEGRWITDGLATDGSLDWDDSPVSIEGEGVWITQLEHTDGTAPTIKLQASEGNGGGVRNMAVYGAGDGVGSANIVETDGDMIDCTFENIIVRYGGGAALYVPGSASGTRIRSGWFENVGGHGIHLGTGTRAKVTDAHIISSDIGIRSQISNSQFKGISMLNPSAEGIYNTGQFDTFTGVYIEGAGADGLRDQSGQENTYGGVTVRGAGAHGISLEASPGGSVSRFRIVDSTDSGLSISSTGADYAVGGGSIENWGSSGTFNYAVSVGGDNNVVSGITARQRDTGTYGTARALAVTGDNNIVNGFRATGTPAYEVVISGADNVINGLHGVAYGDITDNGTRTVINGVGTNAGDPNTTGDWNGNGREGVIVRDTTNSNTYLYNAGTWSQIASA